MRFLGSCFFVWELRIGMSQILLELLEQRVFKTCTSEVCRDQNFVYIRSLNDMKSSTCTTYCYEIE